MTDFSAWTLEGASWSEGAAAPVSDRAFRYGMSVFETIAWRGGRLLFLAEHAQRLRQACAAAGFIFPAGWREAELESLLAPKVDGLVRIYVTAGEGKGSERVFLFHEPAAFPDFAPGFRVMVSRAPLPCPLGGWKTGNYWAHIQATAEAKANGCDEALVGNAQGALVSAAMANVFVVLDGQLFTPALGQGARDGVVRAWVREQILAEETLLSLDDILRAEECFLTNSRLGVMPVGEIEGRVVPARAVGDALAIRYREQVLRT